ncbi:DUF4350 domain-containing protein [Streptomyces sp. FIT100]|uniref:DUF4350 domain-containing protein n=1 Tax=Streptomyces sp. FIT100 TaxID=2837956 RepID=UPI0021C7B522|nr:DUF4350 domain-containing protein [Streptomyces sp. FIT100]UUN27214.1 DUF4350 domain-containing protein [Streptomyces sp. FIT100]
MTTDTTDTTSTSPTSRQIWTRSRGVLLFLVVLIAAGVAIAAVRSGQQHGRLDPRSADGPGSRAVAELLKGQGIDTRVVTTLDEATAATGPDTTLLVVTPDLLTPRQQEALRTAMVPSGGRTVLITPGPPSLGILAPGVRADSPAPISARAPQCALPAAERAGKADIGGERYASKGPLDTVGCYPSKGLPTLLTVKDPGDGDTVLLGSPDILYNERLDKEGNASLALQLLGSRPHLVWYLPSLSDESAADGSGEEGGESSLGELIPSGWLWGTLQLFIAALLAAVWRARRLGPLVTERLPVAIRASEATEGRARLYRKANARDRAASTLRSATRTRLALLLGIASAHAHTPDVLLPSVSTRLTADDRDLRALLFGPAPTDDAALIRLADQLDALEREVRTS